MQKIILFLMLFSSSAFAEIKTSFVDLNLNYLDWSKGTEQKSTKEDFLYLEFEGGAKYDWGDIYGFFDYENVNKMGDRERTAMKGSLNYLLFGTSVGLYAQVYNFTAAGFSEQNRVVGLSYSFEGQSWWFKPFVGFHDVSQTFYSGPNGGMAGASFGYFFKVAGQNFLIVDWHEYEFARDIRYAAGNGGNRESQNGALSGWWNINEKTAIGLQWRYAKDKLGTGGDMDAVIYTFKYFL